MPVSLHGEDDGQDREGNHFQGKCQDSKGAINDLLLYSRLQEALPISTPIARVVMTQGQRNPTYLGVDEDLSRSV